MVTTLRDSDDLENDLRRFARRLYQSGEWLLILLASELGPR
jgi:hypothetical protein